MTVRFYSCLDSGAPVLSGTRLIDRVKLILMACLVNGYGSKAPAGWTVGHDHADGFSLGNGEGFINFVHQTNGVYAAYIMETITAGGAALASGYNRRSGPWFDGSSDTARQYMSGSSFASGSNPYWSVVADGKTAILLAGGGITGADATSNGHVFQHYFGRYLNASGLPAFCSLGGGKSSSTPASQFFSNGAGSVLRHPLTGVVDQGAGASYHGGAGTYGSLASTQSRASAVLDKLHPARAALLCYGAGLSGSSAQNGAIYAGRLRGVLFEPYLTGLPASEALPILGGANTWQSRVTLLDLPGGGQWSPFYGLTSDLGGFVSLSEADWE